MTRPRHLIFVCLIALTSCGPKVAPVVNPTPPPTAFEQKMRWILQLEDERHLRGSGGDLLTLLGDPEARIRRRSALAVGRVRLPEAIPALTPMLQSDADARSASDGRVRHGFDWRCGRNAGTRRGAR